HDPARAGGAGAGLYRAFGPGLCRGGGRVLGRLPAACLARLRRSPRYGGEAHVRLLDRLSVRPVRDARRRSRVGFRMVAMSRNDERKRYQRRLRGRNWALLAVLAAVVVLLYVL